MIPGKKRIYSLLTLQSLKQSWYGTGCRHCSYHYLFFIQHSSADVITSRGAKCLQRHLYEKSCAPWVTENATVAFLYKQFDIVKTKEIHETFLQIFKFIFLVIQFRLSSLTLIYFYPSLADTMMYKKIRYGFLAEVIWRRWDVINHPYCIYDNMKMIRCSSSADDSIKKIKYLSASLLIHMIISKR